MFQKECKFHSRVEKHRDKKNKIVKKKEQKTHTVGNMGDGTIKFIACATHCEGYLPALQETTHRKGLALELIGCGAKFVNLRQKLDWILEFLVNQHDHTVVCVIDAFDILFLGDHSQEVLVKFERMNCNLLFSTETEVNRNHKGVMGVAIKNAIASYKTCIKKGKACINTGGMIGYTWKIRQFIQNALRLASPSNSDDQIILSDYYAQYTGNDVRVDTRYELFYCITHSNSLYSFRIRVAKQRGKDIPLHNEHHQFIGEKVLVKKEQTYPCFVHFNGNLSADAFIRAMQLPAYHTRQAAYIGYKNYVKQTCKEVDIWFYVLIMVVLVITFEIMRKPKYPSTCIVY